MSRSAIFPSPYQFKNNRLYHGIWSQVLYYGGWLLHAPHYALCYFIGKKLTKGSIFHDSAILGLTALLLPFYYLTLGLVLHFIF